MAVTTHKPITDIAKKDVLVRNKLQLRLRLFERRERWGLTFPGKIVLVAIIGFLTFGTIHYGHSFLAVTAPVSSDILVVEGWLPDYALQEVRSMLTQRTRAMIYTTGGPTHWDPYSMNEMDTIAAVAAA